MPEVIKVESDEALAAATAPAFCVIGTAHGRAFGHKVTTHTLLVNYRLARILEAPEGRRERVQTETNILYLLFGGDRASFQKIVTVEQFSGVAFAIKETAHVHLL